MTRDEQLVVHRQLAEVDGGGVLDGSHVSVMSLCRRFLHGTYDMRFSGLWVRPPGQATYPEHPERGHRLSPTVDLTAGLIGITPPARICTLGSPEEEALDGAGSPLRPGPLSGCP
jgi:hypothetical protein